MSCGGTELTVMITLLRRAARLSYRAFNASMHLRRAPRRFAMEKFNISMRKYLKEVGVRIPQAASA